VAEGEGEQDIGSISSSMALTVMYVLFHHACSLESGCDFRIALYIRTLAMASISCHDIHRPCVSCCYLQLSTTPWKDKGRSCMRCSYRWVSVPLSPRHVTERAVQPAQDVYNYAGWEEMDLLGRYNGRSELYMTR